MKSVLKLDPNPQHNNTYPVLMKLIASDLVVLFTNETTGTVVNSSSFGHGQYSVEWYTASDKQVWEKFEGTVSLSND